MSITLDPSIAVNGAHCYPDTVPSQADDLAVWYADSAALVIGPLRYGLYTVIDQADHDLLAGVTLHPTLRRTTGWHITAYRTKNTRGEHCDKTTSLGKHINGSPDRTFHANGNGLDNRRGNLVSATRAGIVAISRPRNDNFSGYKGVHSLSTRGKHIATIFHDGHTRFIGSYDKPEQAAHAYDSAALETFGPYAYTNFPHPVKTDCQAGA